MCRIAFEAAVLFGYLDISVSSPVDFGHYIGSVDYKCRTWGSFVRILERCGSEITYGLGPVNGEFVTAETMMTIVSESCFPTLLTYKKCVRDLTDSCKVADRDLVLQEMDAYYERCRKKSWIYQYALDGYSNVDRACLDIDDMCANESVRYMFPDSNTPLVDAIEFMRGKADLMFECIKTYTTEVLSKLPGCTSEWEDIFFTILISFTKLPRVGIRMFPEQIVKIKDIRHNQNL